MLYPSSTISQIHIIPISEKNEGKEEKNRVYIRITNSNCDARAKTFLFLVVVVRLIIVTEQNRKKKKKREFLYAHFSIEMRRRNCKDRLVILTIFSLIIYFCWFIFRSTNSTHRAYAFAVKNSVPLLHNPQLCTLDLVDVLIVILSSSGHFLERQAIRETWGSLQDLFNIHSQRLFVVGYDKTEEFYRDLVHEGQHEQDVLYLTTDDESLTLKELHAYEWVERYCGNVTYIFKTEDDLFVNIFLLHELIHELQTNSEQFQSRFLYNSSLDAMFLAHLNPDAHTFLFGWAFAPGKPERNESMGFYYVSEREYAKELYPRYCSGFGYLMDAKTRRLVTNEGLKEREPFRFSDIYVTGILPERLHFTCDVLPFTYNQGTTEQCIQFIRQYNKRNAHAAYPPVLVCSTGRHLAQNTFSDYYQIWTVLKYVYADRINSKKNL